MIPKAETCNQELENTQHTATLRETNGNILIWICSSILVNPKTKLQSLLYKAQKYPKSNTEQHLHLKRRPHGIRQTHTHTQIKFAVASIYTGDRFKSKKSLLLNQVQLRIWKRTFKNVFHWSGQKVLGYNIPNVKFSRFIMAQNRQGCCQMLGL